MTILRTTLTQVRQLRSLRSPKGSFRIVGLALTVGVLVGLIVVAVKRAMVVIQKHTLGYAAELLSPGTGAIDRWRVSISLLAGALIICGVSALAARRDRRRGRDAPIDAIEANALRGGFLTTWDGVSVTGPILTSVGCGASVGIEAAVTQIGAVLASLLGQRYGLPRSERRLLVGSGVAAAIAAAYCAPIAGTLYAFELALGEYSTRLLAPVGLAALAAFMVARALQGSSAALFSMPPIMSSSLWSDYPLAVIIGCLSALIGIATMLLVTGSERLLHKLLPTASLRLLAGALLLACLASAWPGVLGSGHAEIVDALGGRIVGQTAAILLGAKIVASSLSLGAGYRGGLFSASLLVGALAGQIVASALAFVPGLPSISPELCMAIGMAAVGASIIGSPLAMVSLVLETGTGIPSTVVIAVGAVIASFLTGRLFGYSFATWRFQQRGLALEGGRDVSRLSAVPIVKLVRPPRRRIQAGADLSTVVRAVAAAGSRGTAVHSPDGAFMGLIDPDLVEVLDEEQFVPVLAADLLYASASNSVVTLDATLARVLEIFGKDDRATIAVVDGKNTGCLIGCIRARDAFALASLQHDEQRRHDLGTNLSSPI